MPATFQETVGLAGLGIIKCGRDMRVTQYCERASPELYLRSVLCCVSERLGMAAKRRQTSHQDTYNNKLATTKSHPDRHQQTKPEPDPRSQTYQQQTFRTDRESSWVWPVWGWAVVGEFPHTCN
eukprot:3349792-Amphidinium_carterae.2